MAMTLAGCSGLESYPGLEYVPDHVIENDEELDMTQVPVMVFVNEQQFFDVKATSRGTGAFENDQTESDKFRNTVIRVFSFRNEGPASQGATTGAPDLTRSAYSPTPETADDRENNSCLVDGEDRLLGMPFKFSAAGNGALEKQVPYDVYYSATYQNAGYNFFAYDIDDFEPTAANTHRETDSIYYDLELDGARDIMIGNAPTLTEEVLNEKYGNLHLTREDRRRILAIGAYSTLSGHRNIQPEIKMKHALTRLKFEALPGDESANRVTINAISLKAMKTARMVVARRNNNALQLHFNKGTEAEIFLGDSLRPGDTKVPPLRRDYYRVEWQDWMEGTDPADRPRTQIGSSLLVAPAESYELYLYFTFTKADGTKKEQRAKYIIVPPVINDDAPAAMKDIFRPGYFYNVRIIVYGLQEIKLLMATPEGWEEVKDPIIIDPDNEVFD